MRSVRIFFGGKSSGKFAESPIGALWILPPQQMRPVSSMNGRSWRTNGVRCVDFDEMLLISLRGMLGVEHF